MKTIVFTCMALIIWGVVLRVIHVARRDKREWETGDYRRW